MNPPEVVVIDYGLANLLNVVRAFEHCGAKVLIAHQPADVPSHGRLVVPGVGAFADCMAEIDRRGYSDVIRQYAASNNPTLGICVGMQILFESSEEFGSHLGLGILKGHVKRIPNTTTNGQHQRVPHIGWNHLLKPMGGSSWANTMLNNYQDGQPAVYFVHSYAAVPENPGVRLADCDYGGHRVCAAVQQDSLVATQFHPERSGEIGLQMIKNFMRM
ncbi:MAG TPA: imidazole glycerol phosphate synthase subunit HisH [Limnobacter sp.]|nr:imidazole glycerol phosphate synthase subunit HisH [Limnobacter sp.]